MLRPSGLEIRLRLDNAQINLAFHSACTMLRPGGLEIRLRLDNGNKKGIFFAIVLGLH